MDDEERGFRQSLWQATASQNFNCSALEANVEADVVIIGGGFTGLSAALHLSELGKSVVVLEGHEIAWGASGRNGAQVNPGWKLLPSEIEALYDGGRGARILKMIDGACDLVFDLIEHHKIDCAPRRAPYFRAAYGAKGCREVEQWVRQWGAYGAPVALRNQQETHDLMGSSFFHGGMEDSRGGSLQPLSYAYGLAEAARLSGARLFTHSRVNTIACDKGDWIAGCENGARVNARYLLIATNGYTDNLWPGLKKQVVPVASLQVATKVLPKDILNSILPNGHHLSDTRREMIYCRIDETGRFQIGGRGGVLTPTVQQADTRHLQAEAVRIYPQLKNVEWEYEWGGLVALTKHHVPHLIELGQNAYAGLGYYGRGVAMGTLMGKQLAELIMGEDVPMPCEKLSPFAFHAFRNMGVSWHMITGRLMDKFM